MPAARGWGPAALAEPPGGSGRVRAAGRRGFHRPPVRPVRGRGRARRPPDFWRVHTSPGGIHGALQKRRAPVTGTGVTAFECTIAVEDVAATAAAIETHGGQLTMQPFEMEHVGTLVMFKDTEGNTVGAMQYLPGIR